MVIWQSKVWSEGGLRGRSQKIEVLLLTRHCDEWEQKLKPLEEIMSDSSSLCENEGLYNVFLEVLSNCD